MGYPMIVSIILRWIAITLIGISVVGLIGYGLVAAFSYSIPVGLLMLILTGCIIGGSAELVEKLFE